jgi:hypothetical protein
LVRERKIGDIAAWHTKLRRLTGMAGGQEWPEGEIEEERREE